MRSLTPSAAQGPPGGPSPNNLEKQGVQGGVGELSQDPALLLCLLLENGLEARKKRLQTATAELVINLLATLLRNDQPRSVEDCQMARDGRDIYLGFLAKFLHTELPTAEFFQQKEPCGMGQGLGDLRPGLQAKTSSFLHIA
jgi:hypothetical protein